MGGRILFGFAMAGLAMGVAALLEVARRGRPILRPPEPVLLPSPTEEYSLPFGPTSPWMGFCNVGGKDFCSNCAAHGVVDGRRVGIYMSEFPASWMAVPFALVGLGE